MADAMCLQLQPLAPDTAWKTPALSKLCWPLGNNFIHRARARADRGEHQAVGEEDPTQRAGTKQTFPTAAGTGCDLSCSCAGTDVGFTEGKT